MQVIPSRYASFSTCKFNFSFWAYKVPTQVSPIFPFLFAVFCWGFSQPLNVSCRYISKSPFIGLLLTGTVVSTTCAVVIFRVKVHELCTSVDDIKLSFIDLIGQLIAMLSVVCQLSQDVLAVKTRKVIGAIRSVYCLSLKVVFCQSKLQVVQSLSHTQFGLSPSISRLYGFGSCRLRFSIQFLLIKDKYKSCSIC